MNTWISLDMEVQEQHMAMMAQRTAGPAHRELSAS
jgi:hypothetical protein